MRDSTTTACVVFEDLLPQRIVARFDQPRGSSDGGAVLSRAADRWLGLTERLSAGLEDSRQPGKVIHELGELLAQRLFAIALGYPDANDAARLADDPIHKLLVGRDPLTGQTLASQPTLSRFEHGVGRPALYRMGEALAETVIVGHRRRRHGRAHTVTVGLDVTDDPTHGAQQLSFFHGYYDTWCYLPLLAFVSFDEEPEQYLVAAVLRPGNAPPSGESSACCASCCPGCARRFRPPAPSSASTVASPARNCWTGSMSKTSTTSWECPPIACSSASSLP
jgi:hypothetical protein